MQRKIQLLMIILIGSLCRILPSSLQGLDIVTGDNLKDQEQGYFRLHINQYNSVQDITCLSKKVRDYLKQALCATISSLPIKELYCN